MGTYIATGLIVKLEVDKSGLKGFDKNFLENQFKKHSNLDMSLFNFIEDEADYCWEISPSILQAELLGFLDKFYKVYNHNSQSGLEDSQEAIEALQQTDPDQWLDLARQKSLYRFQSNTYGSEYYYFDDIQNSIYVKTEHILLTMEGKISFEQFNQHQRLFALGIRNLFPDYRLSRALNVFFT